MSEQNMTDFKNGKFKQYMMTEGNEKDIIYQIGQYRDYIDPMFSEAPEEFQFSTEIGHAAHVIAEESKELQQGKQERSEELIGYSTVLSRNILHLRGSVLSPEVELSIIIPNEFDNKSLPMDNQFVKCKVTWEKQTVDKQIPKEGKDFFQDVHRFNKIYRPVLESWEYLRRDKVFEYPFKVKEFERMVWTSLDAQITRSPTRPDFDIDILEGFLLSSAISTPPVHSEQGGLLSQILAPPEIQAPTTQLIRKIHKLFPDFHVKIKHDNITKEIPYFEYDHETKLSKSQEYLKQRNNSQFDEHSMNLRYDHTSKIDFNGELNLVLPMAISVNKKDDTLRKYFDHIQLYSFIAKVNAPFLDTSMDQINAVQDIVDRNLIRRLDDTKKDKYVGKGKLIDPTHLTEQVHRVVLSEVRKEGSTAIARGDITYIVEQFERLIDYSISEIENSTLERALKDKPVKTPSYSNEQAVVLQTHIQLANSYDNVTEKMLLSEAERDSRLSTSQVRKAYNQLHRGGVFIRIKNQYKEWIVNRV